MYIVNAKSLYSYHHSVDSELDQIRYISHEIYISVLTSRCNLNSNSRNAKKFVTQNKC
jgi:hypothetical protein